MAPVRPPVDALVAAVQRREQQGFDAVWWADHLLHWFPEAIWTPDLVPQAERQSSPHVWMDPFAVVAAAAQHAGRLRLGIGVSDLTRTHPAQMARAALTLDHLTAGRFVLGLGGGEDLNIVPFGIEGARPLARLEEGVALLRRLLTESGPIDWDGEHFRLRHGSVGLEPFGDRPPPVWIAAHRPRGLRLVGREADGWLPLARDPEHYREMLGRVHASAEAAGRDVAEITPGLYVRVVIADSDAEAIAAIDRSLLLRFVALTLADESYRAHGATHPLGAGVFGLTSFLPTDLNRRAALELARQVPEVVLRDTVVHGDPDRIAAQLSAFIDAGARHIQLTNMTPMVAPERAARAEELLGMAIAAVRANGASAS